MRVVRRALIRVTLTAVALFVVAGTASAVGLVSDGQPAATIVIPEDAAQIEREAADELQAYLRQMSGAQLSVTAIDRRPAGPVVLVGRHPEALRRVGHLLDEAHLGYDGIILRSYRDALVVLGHRGSGQLYAVYELLRRLGCRFYLPHPDGEVVPHRETIAVDDLDVVHRPDFIHRVHWNNGNVRPTLADPEWYRDWAVKNYQGGVPMGHGHNYRGFCPADQYFDEHPEYFSLMTDGEGEAVRQPRGQLCLSNLEVVELAVQGAIAAFEARPELGSYSLSPSDNRGWCECDYCRAMDSPDPDVAWAWRVLRFNNQVAERVAERFPDRLLVYYGEYGNMPGPPLGMKAHPNVVAAIVNIYDIIHDIDDPDSERNAIYRKRLRQWDEIVDGMFIYEWYDYSMLPSPQVYVVGPRIRRYHDLGVLGYSGEVLNRSPDNDLSMHIASQMLWDADRDPDEIIDEFFRLYFRGAAPQMRRYYRMLHQTTCFSDNHGVGAPRSAWTPDLIARLYRQLAAAFEATDDPVVTRRLWREQKCLTLTDRVAAAYRYAQEAAGGDASARRRGAAALDSALAHLDRIEDEDIVAEEYIRRSLLPLKTGVLHAQ